MLTYMFIKNEVEDFYDYIMIPLCIFVDIIFIFLQPLFYFVYKIKGVD